MATACRKGDDFILSLPTIMGPPGNLLLVNMAANESVGLSVMMSVKFIGSVLSTSKGRKLKRAAPTEKPCGKSEMLCR